MMVTDAETEAVYRYLRNPRVMPEAILAPHRDATAARARQARRTVAIHDGTEFNYTHLSAATELGQLRQGQRGFLAHLTLLLADAPEFEPLGVPAMSSWARSKRPRGKNPRTGHRRDGAYYAKVKDKETKYWREGVERTEAALGEGVQVTHVMDSGADGYALLSWMQERGSSFVLRSARERRVLDEDGQQWEQTLGELLSQARARVTREVTVRKRVAKSAPSAARRSPPREHRVARVGIAARRVTLRRPYYVKDAPEELEVNAVAVCELNPPEGVEPVAWVLFTSLPIGTVAELERVVDLYVQRFSIEVYIDVLKNRCGAEARRLESGARLQKMLALSIPAAWQLFRLRTLSRRPGRGAEEVVSPRQLQILRRHPDVTLPPEPDAADVLRAIAKLGGNVGKREPGWRVLGRGLDALMAAEVGWILAESQNKM